MAAAVGRAGGCRATQTLPLSVVCQGNAGVGNTGTGAVVADAAGDVESAADAFDAATAYAASASAAAAAAVVAAAVVAAAAVAAAAECGAAAAAAGGGVENADAASVAGFAGDASAAAASDGAEGAAASAAAVAAAGDAASHAAAPVAWAGSSELWTGHQPPCPLRHPSVHAAAVTSRRTCLGGKLLRRSRSDFLPVSSAEALGLWPLEVLVGGPGILLTWRGAG